MKAVIVDDQTKQLLIGEWDDPIAGDNDLLVRIKATALNRADLLQKRGLYPSLPGESPILGLEMAGIVEQVGANVSGWQPGDRVCALLPGGGYAEKAVIPAGMAMRIPASLSFEQAAAIPEAFLTAYLKMLRLGGLRPGQTVLIHAGASGVGTAAIQLAREIGCTVIATAGSDTKLAACTKLGASLVINYKSGPFAPQVLEATDGRGVDLILDFIGAPYWEQNIRCLAVDGRLVLVGLLGGRKIQEVDLNPILMRRLQIIGSTLRSQSVSTKIELTRELVQMAMPRFADGRLQPVIDSVWDVADANEAHAYMEENRNIGKIILRMNP